VVVRISSGSAHRRTPGLLLACVAASSTALPTLALLHTRTRTRSSDWPAAVEQAVPRGSSNLQEPRRQATLGGDRNLACSLLACTAWWEPRGEKSFFYFYTRAREIARDRWHPVVNRLKLRGISERCSKPSTGSN
jgi:hypothetical protein